jgi:DNA polymerase eta
MDLTPLVIERLIALHPHLIDIPKDAPDGIDSPLPPAPPINWRKAGYVIPSREEVEQEEDDRSSDGGENSGLPSWGDWALCIGAEIMGEVREQIWKRLHYTCSSGITHNKAMAKVSSVARQADDLAVFIAQETQWPDRSSPFRCQLFP